MRFSSHAPPGSHEPDISPIGASVAPKVDASSTSKTDASSTAKADTSDASKADASSVPSSPPSLALHPLVPASSRRARVPRWLRRTTGPVLLLALWQLLSATGVLTADVLASPGRIAQVAADLAADGSLPSAMGTSLRRVAAGLLLGLVVGTGLALLSGLFRIGEDLVDAPLQMLRTVPFVGLIPLFIIWFGIGEAPKVAIITLGVTFPLYLNVYAGSAAWTPS
ncbi:hypothetical protein GCM10027074_18180 [Streptomyces deserti]